MRRLADDVVGGVIPAAGHWITEQQTTELAAHLLPFLATRRGDRRQ
jgi:pimeloyl-ACP methyl ester carboxylesterase